MKDESLVFSHEDFGVIWFVAADVCRALGIKNVSQALEDFDVDEKGISNVYTLGGVQEMLIVNEPGLKSNIDYEHLLQNIKEINVARSNLDLLE